MKCVKCHAFESPCNSLFKDGVCILCKVAEMQSGYDGVDWVKAHRVVPRL